MRKLLAALAIACITCVNVYADEEEIVSAPEITVEEVSNEPALTSADAKCPCEKDKKPKA